MQRSMQSVAKTNAAFVLAALFFAFSGIGHMQMMDNHMLAHDCPFAPGVSMCDMSITDHIGMVTSVFSASFSPAGTLGMILLFIECAALLLVFQLFAMQALDARRRYAYILPRTHAPPRTFLQELFADGILHSKAF